MSCKAKVHRTGTRYYVGKKKTGKKLHKTKTAARTQQKAIYAEKARRKLDGIGKQVKDLKTQIVTMKCKIKKLTK